MRSLANVVDRMVLPRSATAVIVMCRMRHHLLLQRCLSLLLFLQKGAALHQGAKNSMP